MRVRLLLFAVLRDVVGSPEIEIELQSGARASDAWRLLQGRHSELTRYDAPPMFAVNESYVKGDQPLNENDELALIPPVSGG